MLAAAYYLEREEKPYGRYQGDSTLPESRWSIRTSLFKRQQLTESMGNKYLPGFQDP
jgi:hypothetical protein